MLEARASACSELIRRQGSGRLSKFFATYTMPSFLAFDDQHQFLSLLLAFGVAVRS